MRTNKPYEMYARLRTESERISPKQDSVLDWKKHREDSEAFLFLSIFLTLLLLFVIWIIGVLT